MAVTLRNGRVCRSWDDFLALSAQRWGELREDLVNGQLGAALARAGQARFVPDPNGKGPPDERLDAWLASLPITRKSDPELDVHPGRVELGASQAPTVARLRVRNVGYRLLKFRLTVEPFADWVELPAEIDGREVAAAEERAIEVTIAPSSGKARARSATLVIESNGGHCEVPIQVRLANTAAGAASTTGGRPVWPFAVAGVLTGALARLATLGAGVSLGHGTALDARAAVVVVALLGLIAGLARVVARPLERLGGGVTGLVGGALVADFLVSAERALGGVPWWLAVVSWTVLGGALGALGSMAVRYRMEGTS
jgi:hypothetical protein